MKLSRTVTINKPVNKVWQVAAEYFANAYKWMTGVVHSYEHKDGKQADAHYRVESVIWKIKKTRFMR